MKSFFVNGKQVLGDQKLILENENAFSYIPEESFDQISNEYKEKCGFVSSAKGSYYLKC